MFLENFVEMGEESQIIVTEVIEDILQRMIVDTTLLEFKKKPASKGRVVPTFSGLNLKYKMGENSNVGSQIAKRSCDKNQCNMVKKIQKLEKEDNCTLSRLRKELKAVGSSLSYVTEDRDHWRRSCNIARQREELLAQENNSITTRIKGLEEQLTEQSSICTGMMTSMLEIVWSLTESPGVISNSLKDFQIQKLLRFSNSVLCISLSKNNPIEEVNLASAVIGILVNLAASGSAIISQTEEGVQITRMLMEIVANKGLNPNLCRLTLMFFYNMALQSDCIDPQKVLPSISFWASSQALSKDGQSVAAKLIIVLQNQKVMDNNFCKKSSLIIEDTEP